MKKLTLTLFIALLLVLLSACFPTPTVTPTSEFWTPTPDVATQPPPPTQLPPPLEGNQIGNPELDGFDNGTCDPRLNIAVSRELWYCGATEKPPGQINRVGWALVDFRNWSMQSANALDHNRIDEPPPWDQLLIPDIYGDRSAQGLQCETPVCILYLQNSGPLTLGIPFQAGQTFNYGIEWNLVALNRQNSAQGFPTGYNWTPVSEDPIIVRILGLHYNPDLNLPPVFDSGYQDCETVSDITDKPTCEPIDLAGNPILVTLEGVFHADETHCPIGETCYLTFRVEFAVNAPTIATAELWIHSAWFNPQ